MDRILIRGLTARCIVGLNPEERREKQEVAVTLALYTDLARAGASDLPGDGIDYRAVKKQVLALVERSEFHLLEALAEAIARVCLEFPLVQEVEVRVEKPSALRFARTVGVEIARRRDSS